MSNHFRIPTTSVVKHGAYVLALMTLLIACGAPPTTSLEQNASPAMSKIHIDPSQIDDTRGVAYEFCIPQDDAKQTEVHAIDTSIQFHRGGRGRIGCTSTQILCIGEKGTRAVLLKLASLDYVMRIDPFYGE